METEKSSAEIGLEVDKKEQALREAIDSYSEVEQQILLISRKIITLQGEKKDLEYAKSKANQNKQLISSELRELKNRFWSARNGGL